MRDYTRFSPVGRKSTNGGMFPFWKAQAKRTAKRKEWAAFVRQTDVDARADAQSVRILEEAAGYEQMLLCIAAQEAEQERRAEETRALVEQEVRWLSQLGAGATYWEALPGGERWSLRCVEYEHEREDYCCFECDGPPVSRWWLGLEAEVAIDREALQWVIHYRMGKYEWGDCRVEFFQHSLEQIQAAAVALTGLYRRGCIVQEIREKGFA